jgi:hypothetical protein
MPGVQLNDQYLEDQPSIGEDCASRAARNGLGLRSGLTAMGLLVVAM